MQYRPMLETLITVKVVPECTSDVPLEAPLAAKVCSHVAYLDVCLHQTLVVVQVVPGGTSNIYSTARVRSHVVYESVCVLQTLVAVQVVPGFTSDVPPEAQF